MSTEISRTYTRLYIRHYELITRQFMYTQNVPTYITGEVSLYCIHVEPTQVFGKPISHVDISCAQTVLLYFIIIIYYIITKELR